MNNAGKVCKASSSLGARMTTAAAKADMTNANDFTIWHNNCFSKSCISCKSAFFHQSITTQYKIISKIPHCEQCTL